MKETNLKSLNILIDRIEKANIELDGGDVIREFFTDNGVGRGINYIECVLQCINDECWDWTNEPNPTDSIGYEAFRLVDAFGLWDTTSYENFEAFLIDYNLK